MNTFHFYNFLVCHAVFRSLSLSLSPFILPLAKCIPVFFILCCQYIWHIQYGPKLVSICLYSIESVDQFRLIRLVKRARDAMCLSGVQLANACWKHSRSQTRISMWLEDVRQSFPFTSRTLFICMRELMNWEFSVLVCVCALCRALVTLYASLKPKSYVRYILILNLSTKLSPTLESIDIYCSRNGELSTHWTRFSFSLILIRSDLAVRTCTHYVSDPRNRIKMFHRLNRCDQSDCVHCEMICRNNNNRKRAEGNRGNKFDRPSID